MVKVAKFCEDTGFFFDTVISSFFLLQSNTTVTLTTLLEMEFFQKYRAEGISGLIRNGIEFRSLLFKPIVHGIGGIHEGLHFIHGL